MSSQKTLHAIVFGGLLVLLSLSAWAQDLPDFQLSETGIEVKKKHTKDSFGICYEFRDCNALGSLNGSTTTRVQLKFCRGTTGIGCSWRLTNSKTCTIAEFRPNPKRCGGDDAMIPLDARIPRPVMDGLDQ